MPLDCPAYLDEEGAETCGLPAEMTGRFTVRSSDGPLECAMIRCPAGHWFNGPIEFLTTAGTIDHDRGNAGAACRPKHDSPTSNHRGLNGMRKFAIREFHFEPGQQIDRPNSAPAYYLGRPARLWIAAMSRRRGRQSTTQGALVQLSR